MDVASPYLNPNAWSATTTAAAAAAEHRPPLVRQPPLREKTKRPQLSCNPCRQRKVKCDRIQPCTACSMHQIADQCQYDLSEAERQPILQAEALKEKDKAIARLRDEVEILRGHPIKSESCDDHHPLLSGTQKSRSLSKPPMQPSDASGHQRILSGAVFDPLCSGLPGMTGVMEEFTHLSVEQQRGGLYYPAAQGNELFPFTTTASHPFPAWWSAKDETIGLVGLLPAKEDVLVYLRAFQRRALSCSFPLVPEECTEHEIQRFLENVEYNATVHPNMLALMFATLALGLQDGIYDSHGEKWIAGVVEAESRKGDVFLAAAMQALRIASFMNRPTLLAVETLIMMGSYLTDCGKFIDASAIFGITVRLAQSIGLHRDPNRFHPLPSVKEIATRKNLWWWMLHMDQHYSMALGQPLAMSSIGDCPAPELLVPDPIFHSLANYYVQLTLVGHRILSTQHVDNVQIDKFTDELQALSQSLPAPVRFDRSWLNREKDLLGWPLDVQAGLLHAKSHNLLIFLNQKRVDNLRRDSFGPPSGSPDCRPRGRIQVLESCRALLLAFEFFQTRVRAAMIHWSMGQMAFNAAMILTLSMLETRETLDLEAVQHTYAAFIEMNKLGVHKLAGAAVERLGSLMKDFPSGDMVKEKVMGQQGMILLEEGGPQGYSSAGTSPCDLQIVHNSLLDRAGNRRSGTGFDFSNPLAPTAKSALAQRRKAHRNSYPGRDVRPRIPSKKPRLRIPRSPIHRFSSGRLAPKKTKQEPDSMNFAIDTSNINTTIPPYTFISSNQPGPSSQQTMFFTAEPSYQTFQSSDFNNPDTSPQQFTNDPLASQLPPASAFPQPSHGLPLIPPHNTPVDPDNQMLSFHPNIVSLDENGFQHQMHTSQEPQPQQQQPQQPHQPKQERLNDQNSHQYIKYSLDGQHFTPNLQFETHAFDMGQVPVTYAPAYQA